MTLLEHKQTGDPYDARNTWFYHMARCTYVATARWIAPSIRDDAFNGPSRHMQTARIWHAESDDLEELREWATVQRANGSEPVNIHRTWPISASKRDNAYLERASMIHPLHTIAARGPHLARSLATLGRYLDAGTFERNAALRLLEREARSAAKASGKHWPALQQRDAAKCMLDTWLSQRPPAVGVTLAAKAARCGDD